MKILINNVETETGVKYVFIPVSEVKALQLSKHEALREAINLNAQIQRLKQTLAVLAEENRGLQKANKIKAGRIQELEDQLEAVTVKDHCIPETCNRLVGVKSKKSSLTNRVLCSWDISRPLDNGDLIEINGRLYQYRTGPGEAEEAENSVDRLLRAVLNEFGINEEVLSHGH